MTWKRTRIRTAEKKEHEIISREKEEYYITCARPLNVLEFQASVKSPVYPVCIINSGAQ